uniref:Uncharacterized protein n=1 Tax=Glycine max TaxID=3847 RepID=A0A0R0IH51_SOYBN
MGLHSFYHFLIILALIASFLFMLSTQVSADSEIRRKLGIHPMPTTPA